MHVFEDTHAHTALAEDSLAGVTGESSPAIVVADLTNRFRPAQAFDRLCFMVRAGNIAGFLGLNGLGKTTTVRAGSGRARTRGHSGRHASGPGNRAHPRRLRNYGGIDYGCDADTARPHRTPAGGRSRARTDLVAFTLDTSRGTQR